MSNIRVPEEVAHRILYSGSPHVAVVESGNGTVVLPHGGHGVAADFAGEAHVSSCKSSAAVIRRSFAVDSITGGRAGGCICMLSWCLHVCT